MKKQFNDRCIDAIFELIGPVRSVSDKFTAKLEEIIRPTHVSGDYDHKLKFTINYPGHNPQPVEDTLTISESHNALNLVEHIGPEYLAKILGELNDNRLIKKN